MFRRRLAPRLFAFASTTTPQAWPSYLPAPCHGSHVTKTGVIIPLLSESVRGFVSPTPVFLCSGGATDQTVSQAASPKMKLSAIRPNMRASDMVKENVIVNNEQNVSFDSIDLVIDEEVVPESISCIKAFLSSKGYSGDDEVDIVFLARGIGKSSSRSLDDGSGGGIAPKKLKQEPTRFSLDLEKVEGNWWTPPSKQGLIFYKEQEAIKPRFVRECHKALWNELKDLEVMADEETDSRALVVKGHPGIGKTVFLDTLAAAIAHSYPKSPIVCVHLTSLYEPTLTLVLGDRRYSKRLTPDAAQEMIEKDWVPNQGEQDGTVFVLHDTRSPEVGTPLEYQEWLVPEISKQWPDRKIVLVLATSPALSSMKKYHQSLAEEFIRQNFWVPMPTCEECKLFVEGVTPKTLSRFDEIHKVMGGAFRYYPHSESLVDAAIREYENCCTACVSSLKDYDPEYQPVGDYIASSYLVCPLVQDDGRKCVGYGFVSTFAWQCYMKKNNDPKLLEKVLEKLQRNENTRDLYDRLFEQYCILRLSQQEAF